MTGKLKYRLFAFLTGLVIAAGAAGISASAEDNGEMRLRVLLRRLNIGQHMRLKPTEAQSEFLRYHRNHVFVDNKG